MQPAADGLAKVLAETMIRRPRVPVIANVHARAHGDAEDIRRNLTAQLTSAVRWQASIERMLADSVEKFVEIGPGRVLTGLMKKISRRTRMVNVSTAEDVAAVSAGGS
jgi:[acyl-carrier-protein] S-malonyltransferase